MRDVRIIPDLTHLPKAPVVTLIARFSWIDPQCLPRTSLKLLYLPQLHRRELRRGDFRLANPGAAGCFFFDRSARLLTPNLQKLPDGGSAVVE